MIATHLILFFLSGPTAGPTVGQAQENDLAQAVTGYKTRTLGQAVETALATSFTRAGGPVDPATETDLAHAVTVIGPPATPVESPLFGRLAEHIGGHVLVTLYDLSVIQPTAQTWYLAEADLAEGALWSGSPAYQGIVTAGTSRPESAVAIGGAAAVPGISLVLADHLGTYRGKGGRRRFSDQFSAPVPGYAEPYELAGAELRVWLAWYAPGLGLTSADRRSVGRYKVVPSSMQRSGETLAMTCESDPTLYRPLPRWRATSSLIPGSIPDLDAHNQPIPIVFGENWAGVGGSALPIIPTQRFNPVAGGFAGTYHLATINPPHEDGSLLGLSSSIVELLTIWTYPITGEQTFQAFVSGFGLATPVLNTAQSGIVLTLDDGDIVAQSIVLPAFYLGQRITLAIKCTTVTPVDVNIALVIGSGDVVPVPTDTLWDPAATATARIGNTGGVVVDVPFDFAQSPWLPGLQQDGVQHVIFVVITHSAPDGGAPEFGLRINSPGTYAGGALWTRVNNGAWVAAGSAFSDPHDPESGFVGDDLDLEVYAIQITALNVLTLSTPPPVTAPALVFSQDPGTRPIGVGMSGIQDSELGTYTGSPLARITNGADVLRFLMRSSLGLGLPGTRVDLESLTVARQRLADWPSLRGVIYEEQDGRTWLARVAKDCKSLVYENQEGQLAVYTDRGNTPMAAPVRLVRPWEHGALTVMSAEQGTEAAMLRPWSRVEVLAGRDLMSVERFRNTAVPPTPGTRATTEWDHYAIISPDLTDPLDAARQGTAIGRAATHGIRGNTGGAFGGATDNITSHFLAGLDDAQTMADYLFDAGRPDPFDVVDVMLPRFAVGWRLMRDIQLESYDFPSGADRCRPGEVQWIGASWDGGTTDWYLARRGRFSIRGVAPLAAHGEQFPVRVTLKLIEWETA